MRKVGAELRTELLRKAVHVGSGLIALTLAWLPWPAALALAIGAFLFNWLILPRLGGHHMHREDEKARGHAFGILVYPLSVAVLVVAFRNRLELAAAGWALMAFGDGMASVVGTLWGKHALSWNPRKTWEGCAAHVVFGAGAAFGIASVVAAGPQESGAVGWPLGIAIAVAAVVTSLVESVDSGIDDNIVVPLLGAFTAWVVVDFLHRAGAFAGATETHRLVLVSAICGLLAIGAVLLGSLTVPGALAAAVTGAVVATYGDWLAFGWLMTFFLLGVTATRVGRRKKEERGIAQSRGGRRGVGNVLANGGLAAALVLLAAGRYSGREYAACLACACAALATAAFDTVSSEVGKAYGRTTVLATTLRRVPPGTEGAISLEGTLAGAIGAALVCIVPGLIVERARAGIYGEGRWLDASWLMDLTGGHVVRPVLFVVAAAFVGATFESVVGSLCQQRGHAIQNDVLNFANTCAGAAAMALLIVLTHPAFPS